MFNQKFTIKFLFIAGHRLGPPVFNRADSALWRMLVWRRLSLRFLIPVSAAAMAVPVSANWIQALGAEREPLLMAPIDEAPPMPTNCDRRAEAGDDKTCSRRTFNPNRLSRQGDRVKNCVTKAI